MTSDCKSCNHCLCVYVCVTVCVYIVYSHTDIDPHTTHCVRDMLGGYWNATKHV